MLNYQFGFVKIKFPTLVTSVSSSLVAFFSYLEPNIISASLSFNELYIPEIYQMYKYFDNILEELLYECIPSKMRYKGFNFVYESHSLERNKYRYAGINSLLPVVSNDNLYSYNKNLSDVTRYRQTETIDYSVVEKNKR